MSPLVGLGDMLTTTGIVFLAGSLLSFFFAAFATKVSRLASVECAA